MIWRTHLAASVAPRIDLRIFSEKLPQSRLISRHFTLAEVIQAYRCFDHDMKVEALKVIVTNEIMMEKSLQVLRKGAIPYPILTHLDSFLGEDAKISLRLKRDVLSLG